MADRLDRAAEVIGDALGKLEVTTAAVAGKAEDGLNEASHVIATSETAGKIQERLAPARKALKKHAAKARKAVKRGATTASKKAARTKKAARGKRRAVPGGSRPTRRPPRSPPRRPRGRYQARRRRPRNRLPPVRGAPGRL